MKAAVLNKIGYPLEIIDTPKPIIAPNEILVRTKACGICGTDIHIQEGWGYVPDLPFVMGHEPSGIVAEIGNNVTRFKVGDRVVTNHFYTCGHCFFCRTNRETLCENLDGILGVLNHWGGYGEYFSVPERQAFPLPETVQFHDGAAICDAVVTAYHATERGRITSGETVMIIGAGGCGLSAAQICKMKGAKVLCVDISEDKLLNSIEYGADATVNVALLDAITKIKEISQQNAIDCVIDTVGNNRSISQACDVVSRGGRVVILGYTQDKYPLDPRQMAVNELEIIGTRSGGRECTVQAINCVARKEWKSIVSDTFPIDDVNIALDKLRSGEAMGRIVLLFD